MRDQHGADAMTDARLAAVGALADEHSILLWQTCAHAQGLADVVRSGGRLAPAYDAMLEFLHCRLLPYLADEEQRLAPTELRDDRLAALLLADHERLRADVANVELSRSRQLLTLASGVLVDRLDRHVGREETWVTDPTSGERRRRPRGLGSATAVQRQRVGGTRAR